MLFAECTGTRHRSKSLLGLAASSQLISHGVTDMIAKFCCDCCHISVAVRPADGKFGTLT